MVSKSTKRTRWLIAVITLVIAMAGTSVYVVSMSANGRGWLEWLSVPLFALLFGWIAFSFVVATLGFVRLLRRRPTAAEAEPSTGDDPPTAVLVPVYNESPIDVFARVEAMVRSLGPDQRFDFFVLSDTNDSEVWLAEELAWSQLMDRLEEQVSTSCNVYYRHRRENVARKAGNIADFCRRWSDPYPFMIVLDADSLLEPDTMIEMVRRMRADDRLGILQVPPTPIGRQSWFARMQQFAAARPTVPYFAKASMLGRPNKETIGATMRSFVSKRFAIAAIYPFCLDKLRWAERSCRMTLSKPRCWFVEAGRSAWPTTSAEVTRSVPQH